MSYSNWDISTSDALLRVQAYTRHIAGTAGYSNTTRPSLSEVEMFLDDSYREIGGLLQSRGYAIAQTSESVMGVLTSLQAAKTAVKVELTSPVVGGSRDEPNSRYKALLAQVESLEKLLASRAFTEMGATRGSDGEDRHHIGGISKDRKTTVESDTDLVPHRFRRGWGQHPGRVASQSSEADAYTDSSTT